MARPWRIQFSEAVYHIVSRGNNKQAIFLDDDDRRDFLELLAQASERFQLKIFAFCLMTNHFHLFLHTAEANLSKAMQWLNTTYTVRFHLRHHRSGHFLQGRFKSVLVTDEDHWKMLSYYVHLNPVRAGLVENPREYEWSSYRDYVSPKSRYDWLCREDVLALFGRKRSAQRKRYRRSCLELCGKPGEFWKEIAEAVVLGSREMLKELIKSYAPRGKKGEVPDFKKVSRPVFEVEDEIERVAEVFGIEEILLRDRWTHHPARLAAYYHLVINCGMKVSTVAEIFGVSPSGVTKGIGRLKERIFDDPGLEKTLNKLIK